jgi:tight adherence protein B
MGTQIAFFCAFLVVLFGLLYMLRVWMIREGARDRLLRDSGAGGGSLWDALAGPVPLVERYAWLCWILGIGIFLLLLWVRPLEFGALTIWITLAISVVFLLVLLQLELLVANGRLSRMEMALANAIDLMVSSLRSGGSIIDSIDTAGREVGGPLGSVTHDLLTRIRYGDDPQKVLVRFSDRVPLDSFRLFATTLAVNWETGGAVSPSLAAVGRSIRDRIEIRRRLAALTMHTWLTMLTLFAISYLLLYVMFTYRPQHVVDFIGHPLGALLFLAVILLQAVGFVWLTSLSRVKF